MRTTKIIKEEAEKALERYNEHYNSCTICQHQPTGPEDEMTCYNAEFLYDDYETLRDQADYAEQIFQQELKERNENVNTVRVCTGCGHVESDPLNRDLGCCPDNRYVPLREFIKAWHEDHVKLARKLLPSHALGPGTKVIVVDEGPVPYDQNNEMEALKKLRYPASTIIAGRPLTRAERRKQNRKSN